MTTIDHLPVSMITALLEAALTLVLFTDAMTVRRRDLQSGGFLEHIPGVEPLGRVVAVTVALSVLLHGVSAVALAERYGRWYGRTTAACGRGLREAAPVPGARNATGSAAWTTPRRSRRPDPVGIPGRER
ncbi:hypothetical protein ACFXOD_08165 [Streptomyces sp. NPDC059161]|uniref:hypothetical protein n=1 Tax=Streptomyces sp. NPDC059161 TaxID=3346749 RepID=UPI0036ADFE93